MSDSSSSSHGMGICGILTIIFVVLKLCGVAPIAAWSWLWVLSPLWISFLLGIGIIALFMILAACSNN